MADQRILANWDGRGAITQWNVKPVVLKEIQTLNFPKAKQSEELPKNLVIEGDCGPVMKTLCTGNFRLKGRIDLMLWDPPYNTGKSDKGSTGNGFIYNDRFYLNKDLAKQLKEHNPEAEWVKSEQLVTDKNTSRHSLWLNFMELRLDLAKRLLAPTGVIAIHIGYQELFRLGILMDQIFGEENRLGIINWECHYSPKNDNKGIPSTTDYVLIYAKNKSGYYRGLLPRTAEMNARYRNPDNDIAGKWKSASLLATSGTKNYQYGIQNPFTGEIHFPTNAYWRRSKENIKALLEKWVPYREDEEGNLVATEKPDPKRLTQTLPTLNFGVKGTGVPSTKTYLKDVTNNGASFGTFWESAEVFDENTSIAIRHEESGNNDSAKKMLRAIMGSCPFDTPKPLKLTERLIKLFCPQDGTVLDAFGGSATTAHGVLSLNKKEDASRKFVIIEYKPEKGSSLPAYANTITAERIRRVISGKWAKPTKDTRPLPGQFAFFQEEKAITKSHLLAASCVQLTDTILSMHDINGFTSQIPKGSKYVIGTTMDQRAIILHWEGQGESDFTKEIYWEVMEEVKKLKLNTSPMEVYAETNSCAIGSSFNFNRITEDILLKLCINS